MPFETTISAFAAALGEPSAAPPAMTRGRLGAPDARRFAVYRNNVAVGLIGALEARYPVSRRIAGDDAVPRHGARVRSGPEAALAGHDRLRRGFPGVRRALLPGRSLASPTSPGSRTPGSRRTTPRTRRRDDRRARRIEPRLFARNADRVSPRRAASCGFRPPPPRSGPRAQDGDGPAAPIQAIGGGRARHPSRLPTSGCASCRRLATISP